MEDPPFSDYSDWDFSDFSSQKHGLKVLIVLKASRSSRFCSAWVILDPKAIVPLADELVLKTASAVGISGFQVQPFQN